MDLFIVIRQLCYEKRGGRQKKRSLNLLFGPRLSHYFPKKRNTRTAGESVLAILLVNRCYLLKERLHFLAAAKTKAVQGSQLKSCFLTVGFTPAPHLPLITGLALRELGLFYQQLLQSVLELVYSRGVYGQMLVNLWRK